MAHGGDLSLVSAVTSGSRGAGCRVLRTAIFDVLACTTPVSTSSTDHGAGGRRLAGSGRCPGESAFYSTPADLLAFVEALLLRHGSLLSQSSFDWCT